MSDAQEASAPMKFESDPDPKRLKLRTLPASGMRVMLTDEEWAQFATSAEKRQDV